MYRGQYQLGEEVWLALLVQDANGIPTNPDAAPQMDVYDGSSKHLLGISVPVLDPAATVGFFAGRIFLDESFSPGQYTVSYRWNLSGSHGASLDTFTIIPGGAGSGQVISMYDYERPQGVFILQQRTSGRIYKGKNPRL